MFIATHVAMGTIIGQNVPSAGLAFGLSVASHFMLDLVPHGDSKLYRNYKAGISTARSLIYVAIDSSFSIGLFVYLLENAAYASRSMIILSVIGAILPDLLVALAEAFPGRAGAWIQRTHMRIHDSVASRLGEIRFRTGVALQLVVLTALLLTVRS